jgi:hypothetical protein
VLIAFDLIELDGEDLRRTRKRQALAYVYFEDEPGVTVAP